MSNSGSGSAQHDSGRNYGLEGDDSMGGKGTVHGYTEQLRALGITVEQVWSPEDTVADTRYMVRAPGAESQTLFHREVAGFIAGIREAQSATGG